MGRHPKAALLDAILTLRYEAAASRFVLSAGRLRGGLAELRYNPDWPSQPRVPAGDVAGGRWTDGAGAADQASEITPFGLLKHQFRDGDTLFCLYDFGGQTWVVQYIKSGSVGCYRLIHQSTAFGLGLRLNDN